MAAQDGKIYFAPDCAAKVLCIDPATQSVELVGPDMQGYFRYSVGGVEAFFRAWIRLETHDSDDAWQAPWDANRVEIGVRHSRVMQERDW